MNIDLKTILPYLAILISIGMSWGMMTERLEAVEKKADTISQTPKHTQHLSLIHI